MNICIMTGRPTGDPDIRYAQSGTAIASFTLAVNRTYKREGQPDADFHKCICFGKIAEFVEKYISKGTKINVIGELHDNNYDDRNGQKVYGKQIVCNSIEFAESKSASGSAGNTQKKRNSQKQPETDKDGFINIPDGIDEELPFA